MYRSTYIMRNGKTQYTYREYKPEDKADIIELFGLVWNEKVKVLTSKVWDWKYFETSIRSGNSPTVFVMECDHKVVGVMGTLATGVSVKGNCLPAVFGSDLLVHPKHLSAGIGFLRHIFNVIEVVQLGTPNDRAYQLEKRMGCEDLSQFNDYTNMIDLGVYLSSTKRINKGLGIVLSVVYRSAYCLLFSTRTFVAKNNQLYCQEVHQIGEQFDVFWLKVSSSYESITLRNKEFLDWRFFKSPNAANYKILTVINKNEKNKGISGYLVYSTYTQNGLKRGKIVDFLVEKNDEQSLSLLIKTAINILIKEKVTLISLSMTDGHDWCESVF